jgi:hypothetical protein
MIERRRLFFRRDFLLDIAQFLPCLSRKLLFHLHAYSQQTTQSGALAAEAKLACPFIRKWLLPRYARHHQLINDCESVFAIGHIRTRQVVFRTSLCGKNHQSFLVTMVTPLRTILSAGLLAGFLDGIAAAAQAYLMRGMNPVIVFQYVASGALGRSAFDGGWLTAGLGIVFHLAIALSWAALFFFAYPSFSFLAKSRVFNGVAYGLLIWLTMNLLVVPMSRIPARPFVLLNVVTGMLILIVMVGMPVAFIVPKYYLRRQHRAHGQLLAETVREGE